MATRWENMTDDELTEVAQAGLTGQGATIEMLRRISRVAQQNTTRRLTWVIVTCTVLLLLAQSAQLYLQWQSLAVGQQFQETVLTLEKQRFQPRPYLLQERAPKVPAKSATPKERRQP